MRLPRCVLLLSLALLSLALLSPALQAQEAAVDACAPKLYRWQEDCRGLFLPTTLKQNCQPETGLVMHLDAGVTGEQV